MTPHTTLPEPVGSFLARIPDDRRPILEAVDRVVRDAAPELRPAMWDGVLGYGNCRYRYASGRAGEWFVVGLANRKQYVSVYVNATEDGAYLAEANAARLGKVSVGRSCIRFRRLEDIDLGVLGELVRSAADSAQGGTAAAGGTGS
ncbi:MAG: DUF1801 domain-containing protein [Actinomycetota bacterium]